MKNYLFKPEKEILIEQPKSFIDETRGILKATIAVSAAVVIALGAKYKLDSSKPPEPQTPTSDIQVNIPFHIEIPLNENQLPHPEALINTYGYFFADTAGSYVYTDTEHQIVQVSFANHRGSIMFDRDTIYLWKPNRSHFVTCHFIGNQGECTTPNL